MIITTLVLLSHVTGTMSLHLNYEHYVPHVKLLRNENHYFVAAIKFKRKAANASRMFANL